jgi:HTH-type transcriptional regulator, transcriptional repressor of NAD biosynthesis genes
MTRRYKRGLVVGKFCPLHLGHELLISRARECCEEVVVISYAKPGYAGYGPERRNAWLAARFPEVTRLVIDDTSLSGLCHSGRIGEVPGIPFDDEADDVHRKFVAWLCTEVLKRTVDAVFTSESYGDGFADVLAASFGHNVEHVCVDRARAMVPVSGTQVRVDPYRSRQYLANDVYASFVRRICILGGESTGKTTMAKALAEALNTTWAAEFGRELWDEKGGQLAFDDMLYIGRTQIDREVALAGDANRVLVCDTSPLTTVFYSEAMFGVAAPELQALGERIYDLVFLCAPDFDFVQDGTRRDREFRARQHSWYQTTLAARKITFSLLEGPVERRLRDALAQVSALGT